MPYINEIRIMGHLGSDPASSHSQNGTAMCRLSIATSYKPKEGEQITQWHRVLVFGQQAEYTVERSRKGDLIYVLGRMEYGSYRDKDGLEVRTATIVASRVLNLMRRKYTEDNNAVNTESTEYPDDVSTESPEGPCPF
jgi:single-strand DNA-binding protein